MKLQRFKKSNQKFRIGFILDPIERLVVEDDTSLLLLKECERRGHRVFYIHQEDIFLDNGIPMANLNYVEFDNQFNFLKSERKLEPLSSLDAIFMRLEPPYDLNYIYITQILELIGNNTFILNDPKGLREANEKLYPLKFSKFIPKTIVTKDINLLKHFLRESGKIIIKQLNLYASKELVLISNKEKDVYPILERATESKKKYVMAQEFLNEVYKTGDKRSIVLSGKILGCYTRVPKKNDFRSDPDFGGINKRTELTKREKEICHVVSRKLLEDGIYFAGIDMIGERLTEINVTCPAGIIPLNKLYGKKLEGEIIDFLERKIFEKIYF